MTDQERIERFEKVLIAAEIQVKTLIVETAEEQLETGAERIGLITCLSLGMAAAALASACEAVAERNDRDVGSMAIGVFDDNVKPLIERLKRLVGDA